MPIACYRPARCCPAVIAITVSRSLPKEQTKDKSKVRSCCFLSGQIMAQPLNWLLLIAIAIGRCLMNGYLVVNVLWRSKQNRKTSHSICR